MPTYLHLLGPPAAERDGRIVVLRPERRHQLLAWLALQARPVNRDQLAALFWPERDNATARRNLRKLAFDVQALDWAEGLAGDRACLAWTVATDVADLERALAGGRIDEAARLYRGPLCDGLEDPRHDGFAEALRFERLRLADRWRAAIVAGLEATGTEPATTLVLAQRLLAADPSDEMAVAAAMRAHVALGRPAEGARVYQGFKERLAASLGIEPSAQLRELARRLEPGAPERHVVAPLPGAAGAEFVGRTTELKELQALVAREECRLVTITGPGGIGKSRLAKAALPALEPAFAGGTWWVPLDDLHQAASVAPRIAQIAGIELSGAAAAIETVGAWFVSRRALLVLDNAEQIDDVGGLIGRLMHLAPGLKLIVTSRRRLGAPHEWLLPLGGLDVPPEGSTGAAAAGSDAVQLFVLRARAAQPALDPSRDAEAIARLVRGLGGLPLAIELAAAWVRLLPVADIEVEVASSFDLLERAEDGDERPEHRSVRATFEQSWRLLGPHERELFAALSVFRAPFSRAAAAVIGGASLALLVSLADKSLLRTEAGGRFSLHPLLARFGAEKLARNPDGQSRVRQRHAEYFCRALSAWETWHRVDQKEAVAQVSRELADAVEACRWALAHRQASLVSTALGVLGHVCDLGGRLDEGLALLGEAERALPEQGRPNLLALAQAALSRAMIQSRAARFDASLEDAKRSMRLYRAAREPRGMRMAITAVTNGLTKIGRYVQARRYCEQGLRACEQDRDAENLPVFLNNLALVESQCGFPERAVPLYERALGLSRAAGDRMGIVAQLNNLSAALIAAGAPKRAVPHLDEGLRLLEEAGFVGQQSYFFANLAQACFDLGDLPAARRWAELGLQSVRKGSDRSSEPGCLILLGRIAQAQGNMDEARALLRRGAQAAADMHLRRFMVRAVLAFAAFCLHDGRPGEAARLLACVEASGLANRIDLQRAEPLFENTRSALDPQALAEAEAAGRRISLDAALAWIGQPR